MHDPTALPPPGATGRPAGPGDRPPLNRHGWLVPRSFTPEPERKLSEICDGDRRTTDPSTAAVAAAVLADTPTPDPYTSRERFETVLTAARAYLGAQPSPRQIKAAAGRISRAVLALAGQLAKEGDR